MTFTDQLLSGPNEVHMVEDLELMADGWYMAFTDQLVSGPNEVIYGRVL